MNQRLNPPIYTPGTKVAKRALRGCKEPKPFKSGSKVNTIKEVTTNPNTGKPAYLFEEDESVVDCFLCVEEMKDATQ